MTFDRRTVRAGLAVSAAAALTVAAAPVAPAQIPEGMDPEQVQSMIPSEVTVRAGETTTVDLGVPVDVSYSGGGWQVSSSGTQVSVTAPDTPGATASVPASAGGMSATVNLVAVGDGEEAIADDAAGDAASDGEGSGASGGSEGGNGGGRSAGGAEGSGGSSSGGSASDRSGGQGDDASGNSRGTDRAGGAGGAAVPPRTDRDAAEPVDTSTAKKLYFDGEIQDNTLVVKVSLRKASDLMKYANADREGAKLRYVDVNGNIIEDVQRDVNVAKRTLTLTYPEGETPDSPFIMEVVRDGKAEFIAVITATNAPSQEATGEEDNPYADAAQDQGEGVDSSSRGGSVIPLVIGGIALLAALALIVVFFVRRSRARG